MVSIPDIVEFGDSAFLVNFESTISPDINNLVHRLDQMICRVGHNSIKYTIPAYCSLTVGYDKQVISGAEFRSILHRATLELEHLSDLQSNKSIAIPVCFDKDFAHNRERLCVHTGLRWEDIVSKICAELYQVYMIGFVAGFPYMGKLHEELRCPRLEIPRKRVESGSVAIAEAQCGIYPVESPGGWNIIGKTPVQLVTGDGEDPFLLHPSDEVTLVPISISEFNRLHQTPGIWKFENSPGK